MTLSLAEAAGEAYNAAVQPAHDAQKAAIAAAGAARETAALSRATAAVLARIEYHGWPDDARHLLAENIARVAVAAYLEGAK